MSEEYQRLEIEILEAFELTEFLIALNIPIKVVISVLGYLETYFHGFSKDPRCIQMVAASFCNYIDVVYRLVPSEFKRISLVAYIPRYISLCREPLVLGNIIETKSCMLQSSENV